jgi:hypothetical protein
MLTARIDSLLESGAYAKAGLMLRFGQHGDASYASAPFVMVNTFPDGAVALLSRDAPGATAKELKRFPGPLPRRLAFLHDGARVRGLVEDANGRWVELGEITFPATSLAHPAEIGLAVTSQQQNGLTRAAFSDLTFTHDPRKIMSAAVQPRLLGATSASPSNLLRNGAFDEADGTSDFAANWNRWGSIRLERGDDGSFISTDHDDSGIWQDVKVRAGQEYEFTALARRAGAAGRDSGSVELRLEGLLDDGRPVALASSEFQFQYLEEPGGWSTLHVRGKAISNTLRVLIRVNPSAKSASQVTVNLKNAIVIGAR